MPRPQFNIRTLFWLTLIVAALLAVGVPLAKRYQKHRAWEEFNNSPMPTPRDAAKLVNDIGE